MPIDHTIALNVKQPAPIDFTKFAQLRNLASQDELIRQQINASKTSEAAQAAGIPTIQAQAETAQRALGFERWIGANKGQYLKKDGTFDTEKFIPDAIGAGYRNEANAVMLADIDRATKKASQAKTETEAVDANFNVKHKIEGHLAQVLSNTPPERMAETAMGAADLLNKISPGTGDTAIQSLLAVGPDGKPVMDQAGKPTIDPVKVKALRLATMSPQQQELLGISKDAQAFTFAKDAYTADGRNPNSKVSSNARDFARASGIDVPDTMDLFTMLNSVPGFKEAMTSAQAANIVPVSTKAEAAINQERLKATIKNYDSALDSVGKVNKSILGTRLGTIGTTGYLRFLQQNPELAGLDTAVQIHNNNFPNDPINTATQTVGEIKAKLNAGRSMLATQLPGAEVLQQKRTFSTPSTPTSTTTTPPTAKTGTVKMAKAGRVVSVPENEVDEAGKSGWVKVPGGK